jgi:hypothetical protein
LSQSDAAVAGDPAIIRRPRLERVGSSDAGSAKKETGPARARLQFIGARPTITFLVHNGDEEVTREEWRFTEICGGA